MRQAQSGFTFVELVVVVLIMGILAGIAVPAYFAFAERAARKSTRATLNTVKTQINVYRSDTGKYPTKIEDLVTKPTGADAKGWDGPYLMSVPKDGWKSELIYKKTPGGKHPYELASYGKSGPEGGTGEDEISVWDEE